MTEFLSTVERINSELLTFTYGSLIVRLIKDYEKPEEINEQLEKMGYNIGIRIIDDYLAKSCISPRPSNRRLRSSKQRLCPSTLTLG